MKFGFTGTQQGITEAQRNALGWLLVGRRTFGDREASELHHGDCVGADADVNALAGFLGLKRVLHPPSDDSKRAFCEGEEVLEPKPYLERNHDIVDVTEVLLATPRGDKEERRSGTWATVRYAEKIHRPIKVIWPDGRVEDWKRGQEIGTRPTEGSTASST